MAARGSMVEVTVRRNLVTGWLADRSVNTKGLLAAGITAAVALGVGLLAVNRMAELDNDLGEMKQVHVASQETLGDVRSAAGEVFRGMFLYTNPEASAYQGEGERNVDDADALMERAVATYRALPGSSARRTAALDALADAWTDHSTLRDAVIFDKALPAGQTMPAKEVIGTRLNSHEQRMKAAISDLIALQHTEAEALAQEASGDYRSARSMMFVALGVGLLLAFLVSLWTARIMRRQLLDANLALAALAEGNLANVAEVRSRDELGRITEAVNRASAGLRQMVQALTSGARTLGESSQQLSGVTGRIDGSAQEAAAQAMLVAAAAGEVSANVQTVAAGSQQMGASIQEIARNANDAAVVAAEAVGVAESTNQTVSKLGESSAEIGNVVKVITSIAGQTNLLALNATIEAARAGESGKGFAVVANEVKDLAQETARATEDISRRVEAIQSDTANAVAAIGEISQIIARINDYQLTIASAVEEQTATTTEMTRSVGDAASGTADIAANIGGVAEATRMTTTTLAEAEHTMAELASVAADLQIVVGQFRL